MSKLSIDQRNIKSLFQDRKSDFLIPDYQRPYAWNEEKCETLWEDLFSFAFPNNNIEKFDEDDEYFLGPIVTYQNDNKKLLLEVIEKSLRPREIKIIKMRFGFEGMPMTLEEIGKEFKVTRERIRQVEDKALMRIRRYMKSHEMFKRSDWNVD